MKRFVCFLGCLAVMLSASASTCFAEDSVEKITKELSNPNTSLARLTFKNQYRWYTGDLPGADDQGNYTLLFQPSFPFNLGEDASGDKASIFFRPAFPILFDQPVFSAERGAFDDADAVLGDIGFDLSYGVSQKDGFIWAFGMVGTLPTATDSDVAGKQLRLGPEMLVAQFVEWGIYGLFPSHEWDVSGWSDSGYSASTVQLFVAYGEQYLEHLSRNGPVFGTI